MSKQGYYLVRAREQAQADFDVFLNNDEEVVAVGWSKVDFTAAASEDAVADRVWEQYYKEGHVAAQVIGKKKNEVRRFKGLRKGDRIVIPHWGDIHIAIATGRERFNRKDAINRDLGNQHVVQFQRFDDGKLASFPRGSLSLALQSRMRVRGATISDLNEFGEEIEKLVHGEAYTDSIDRSIDEQKIAFVRHFAAILQDGTSALQAGGIGLERLVAELLQADGYSAKVQSKKRFPELADADVEAIRDDHVTSVKLLVQVKHHSGTSDVWGAQQLQNILNKQPDVFSEYQLVLVTSAKASKDLQQFCDDHDIRLITGIELAEWIADDWSRLSKDTLHRLRLGNVPQIIQGRSA